MESAIRAERLPDREVVKTIEHEDKALRLDAAGAMRLITAKQLAVMLVCSEAHVWRLHSCARVPMPLKLGRLTRWRAREVEEWIEAGCPPRHRWDAMRQIAKN